MPEPFVITELTGSQRSVELRDRCLPYQPVAFPGEQRSERTHYAGNPVATIQVLGPDETDLEIQGRWKDRFLRKGEQVVLTGWDEIVSNGETVTAEQLVQVFHSLRRSGNQVEVRWGPEVRRGIVKRFEPRYRRLDVIEWSVRFEWSQLGTALPSPFTSAQTTATMSAELAATLAALNDLAAGIPPIMFPTFIDDILALVGEIQAATIELTISLGEVTGVPSVTQEEFQGVASKTSDVVVATEALRRDVGDSPVNQMVPTDDLASHLEVATWARDMSASLTQVSAASIEARESIRDRVASAYIADIRLRAGQTLRDVAFEYYGAPDDWTYIADANGLVGSIHPAGTRVLVPRREAGGGRAA